MQWHSAKRWMRILEAIPQEEGSYERLVELANKYKEIDEVRAEKHCIKLPPKEETKIEDLYGIPAVEMPTEEDEYDPITMDSANMEE